jgi:hypothetical protein
MENRPQNSDRKEFWRQNKRSNTYRNAEGQLPASHEKSEGQGHEWRGHDDDTKVFGEKPEGVKTQEGIEVLAGLNRLSVTSNRWLDQSPEGERRDLVPLR